MKKIWLFNLAVFLAAFLLFQIELIIAKKFLPYYGGSYFVWGACVVFFQAALLAGYIFSHAAIRKIGTERYSYFYLILLLLPLSEFSSRGFLPLVPNNQIPVVCDIFLNLIINIGLVFFILATVSVSLQALTAASSLARTENIYQLYAWSNLGSFAALVTYPFYFESIFDLEQQARIWRAGYLVLAAILWAGFFLVRFKGRGGQVQAGPLDIKREDVIRWLLLGAVGVMMFLAVTNIITNEIAPIPLLWVIPLSIYLFTFVLSFRDKPWCPRWIPEKMWLIVGSGILVHLLTEAGFLKFLSVWAFLLYGCFLFVICLYCQNQLYLSRPKDQNALTYFYVIISLGSFLGGIFVSWVIPLISSSLIEFLAGLFILAVVLARKPELADDKDYYLRLMVIMWVLFFQNYPIWGVALVILFLGFLFRYFKEKPRLIFYLLISLLYFSPLQGGLNSRHYVYRHRNYYGIIKVAEDRQARYFIHGNTVHGAQYLAPEKQAEPLTYYHYTTPVGKLMRAAQFQFADVGIIGLGAGALAAYAQEGQVFDFFELDPDVYKTAQSNFTYLKNAKGQINYFFGDARLMLDQIKGKRYDLFIVDAFGGDAVPIHLLTIEAIEKYRKYLKKDGVILFHFTNQYLRLAPVITRNALSQDAYIAYQQNPADPDKIVLSSSWFALTWDPRKYNVLTQDLNWQRPDEVNAGKTRPWTDQYSNILPYIHIGDPLAIFREILKGDT